MADTTWFSREWAKQCPEEEYDRLVELTFNHYRQHGFPYFNQPLESRVKDFKALLKFNRSSIIDEQGIIHQSMHGLGLAWYYQPHSWGVSCNGGITPLQAFNDDVKFRALIRRRLHRGATLDANEVIVPNYLRKALKATNTQAVSNFRPSAAAAIYDRFAGDGVVWDMSGGYGGRLLGALASHRVKEYIATEPCTATIEGLGRMNMDINAGVLAVSGLGKAVTLVHSGSEDFIPNKEVDLCFTSPPYFDTEMYSDEPTQSYLRYDTVAEWDEHFLGGTIRNCRQCLRKDGLLMLNVADVRHHPTLIGSTIEQAERNGFKKVGVLMYAMSHIRNGGFKGEPVLVFEKAGRHA